MLEVRRALGGFSGIYYGAEWKGSRMIKRMESRSNAHCVRAVACVLRRLIYVRTIVGMTPWQFGRSDDFEARIGCDKFLIRLWCGRFGVTRHATRRNTPHAWPLGLGNLTNRS